MQNTATKAINLPSKKIFLITRTKNDEDFKKNGDLERLINTIDETEIETVYIVSDFSDTNYSNFNTKSTKIIVVKDDDPTGPVSINTAIKKISNMNNKPFAFLVASKEVFLTKEHVNHLILEIKTNPSLLVAGYKFLIQDTLLNNELQKYYFDNNSIAFQVPWNTCAIWNYNLFVDNISNFDELTANKVGKKIKVLIRGVSIESDCKGMEDGLAISKAISNNNKLCFKLMTPKTPLIWNINLDQRQDHEIKLARKDLVMRDFIKKRGYSVKDLIRKFPTRS